MSRLIAGAGQPCCFWYPKIHHSDNAWTV